MIFLNLFLFFVISGQAASSDLKGCLHGDVTCFRQQVLYGLGRFFDRESVEGLGEMSKALSDWGNEGKVLKTTEDDASGVQNRTYDEGRSHHHGRRTIKKLLPILLALKIQYLAIIAGVAYLAVLLIAKLALLKGSLALGLGIVAVFRLLNSPLLRTELQVHTNGGYETIAVPEQHLNNFLPQNLNFLPPNHNFLSQNHLRRQKNVYFKMQKHPENS